MALSAPKKVARLGTSAGGDAFLMTVTAAATVYAGAALVMIDGYNTVSPATAAANLRSAVLHNLHHSLIQSLVLPKFGVSLVFSK